MQLWKRTTKDVVGMLARREVRAVEAVMALAARIEAVAGSINPVAAMRLDQALEEARAVDVDGVAARRSRDARGLHGLPVLIKDMTDVAGLATTLGDPARAATPAPRSDICVERIASNGGIVLGKSNVPFMGLGHDTTNPLYGTTRNPWDPRRSTAGSSGGAAAALACGAAWLAHGTDLGGSIRVPASHCGVVGLRPTPGVIAHGGIDTRRDPLEDQNLDGPMARDVQDCALFFDAMAGAHEEDPLSKPFKGIGCAQALGGTPSSALRVAVTTDLGCVRVHADVAEATRRAAAALAAMGASIEERHPDTAGLADAAYDLRLAWTRRRTSRGEFAAKRPFMSPPAVRTHLDAFDLTIDRLLAAQNRQQKLVDDMRRMFRDVDCLIMPATPEPPPLLRAETPDGSGHDGEHWVHQALLSYAVTLSWCPSLVVPVALTPEGLPIGVQIVGPPRSERRLFRVGLFLERWAGIASRLPLDDFAVPEPRPAPANA
jgi:amidase